ncbi:hypothetical protein [Salibacter sp.]|uniref:hypothetical protein n=1 Tax=Salibacter sp. TaxID=2010995 RepID=UPI00286FCB5E|nr:hypothetical protein [Salibacter sp.]MDR9399271.1 hypothetical protein [Salibacter sp.]MDR9486924.1 hypothetical protein [Salibacter sp.]
MQKLLGTFVVIVLSLAACHTPNWTKTTEKEFVENCVNSTAEALEYDEAKLYCECALEYAKEKSSNPEVARDMNDADYQNIKERCFDSAKEEAKKLRDGK